MADYKPIYVEKVIYTREQIEAAIKKAAKWINKHYAHCKKPPLLLGILKGAIPFYGRLIMDVKIECLTDFIVLSSFRGQLTRMGDPEVIRDLITNIKGRDVIVIEDIVDTASTISLLKKYLLDKKPKTLATVCLVDKVDMRKVPYKVDYACFTLHGNPFLIGYGLDVKEVARNIPCIGTFKKKYFDKL